MDVMESSSITATFGYANRAYAIELVGLAHQALSYEGACGTWAPLIFASPPPKNCAFPDKMGKT